MQHFSFRDLVQSEDLNGAGVLYGGKTMFWLDKAAAMYAMCQMGTPEVVTANAVIDFKKPANLGECVEFYCKTTKIGNSSLTVETGAYVHDFGKGVDLDNPIIVCTMVFVHVKTIDGKKVPTKFPKHPDFAPKAKGYYNLSDFEGKN